MKKPLTVLALCLLLGACANTPPLNREQQLAATTRLYPGADREAVIDAARRVLQLADGDDFVFADNLDGFVASRRWFIFMIFGGVVGTDTWAFRLRDTPQGPVASLGIGRQEQGVQMQPTTAPNVYSAGTTLVYGSPVPGNAVYDLFWRRMEYMLHRTDTWATCKDLQSSIASGALVGPTDTLCSLTVSDFAPNEDLDLRPKAPPSTHTTQQWDAPAPLGRAIDRKPKP